MLRVAPRGDDSVWAERERAQMATKEDGGLGGNINNGVPKGGGLKHH